MSKIYIYSEDFNPRLQYVLGFIQQFNLENEWLLCTSLKEYLQHSGISINYSVLKIKENEYQMYNSGYLFSKLKDYQNIPVRNSELDFQIFPNTENKQFDVFAAIFYLIARVEEYLPFQKDSHQRFSSQQSLLKKNKALEQPIVDYWIKQFFITLENKFNYSLTPNRNPLSFSLGVDVDQFFKHKHKSFFRQAGSFLKLLLNRNNKELIHKFKIVFLNYPDPFDTFDLFQSLKLEKKQILFFILSGGRSNYDKNHSLNIKIIRELIQKLNQFAIIGLHPSYESFKSEEILKAEKNTLEECLGIPVINSRHHYLKINFPDTYRNLISAGIETDYSMGYADSPGFRAGTCREFFWYDLLNETETKLLIRPLIAMDRSYLDYLKVPPEEAIHSIKKLYNVCRFYGGHFHLVWHNSSFDYTNEWKSWENVLSTFLSHYNEQE